MRKILFLVIHVFLVQMAVCADAYQYELPINSGLVAWYKLNGNVNDHSGNSRNGTVVNAHLSYDRNFCSNAAYSCNNDGGVSLRLSNFSSYYPDGCVINNGQSFSVMWDNKMQEPRGINGTSWTGIDWLYASYDALPYPVVQTSSKNATYCFWVKIDGLPVLGQQCIFSRQITTPYIEMPHDGMSGYSYYLYFGGNPEVKFDNEWQRDTRVYQSATDNYAISLSIDNNGDLLWTEDKAKLVSSTYTKYRSDVQETIHYPGISKGDSASFILASSGLSIGKWHFVTIVGVGGASISVYVDGELVGTHASGVESFAWIHPVDGRYFTGTWGILHEGAITQLAADLNIGSWNGAIDEMLFYDRALQSSEIKSIYDAGKPLPIIYFDSAGGDWQPIPKAVAEGQKIGTLPDISRKGFAFKGWFTAKDGGVQVNADTISGSKEDTTLFAHWEKVLCTIAFDTQCLDVDEPTNLWLQADFPFGELPNVARVGYDFRGWFSLSSGGDQINSNSVVVGNCVLFAQWDEAWRTIVFDSNGGTEVEKLNLRAGYKFGTLPLPEKFGHRFLGWYSQHYDGIRVSEQSLVSSSCTLYAYWERLCYEVSFESNGGSGAMTNEAYFVGEAKALNDNAFVRMGYTFQGWATTPNGNVKYSNGASVSNLSYVDGEKVTLYAVWKRNVYEQVRCGFLTSTFTGSTSLDTSSDIWNNSSQYTEAATGIYATSLNEKTTIAYGTHMYMEKGVTYRFKGLYDDWVGVRVDNAWIAKNSTECNQCSGSYLATYSGWHKVEFRVGNNGGPGGCLNSSHYGIKWCTSQDSTWRDINATTYWPMFSVAPPVVVSGSPNTASPVASVDGTAYIHFAKIDDAPDCVLKIDGENYITSESLYDVGIWQPRTLGTHTITWSSGGKTATMSINVTSLAFPTTPEPTPPTGVDENITIKSTSKAFGSGNGSGTIATTGSGTCAVTSSADWIVIPAAMASRNAGLAIAYTVTASTEAEERTGYIYISGHVFTVTQAGVGAELDEYEAECEQEGGKGSVTVLVDSQTGWIARSNVDWISLTTTSGTGEAEVEYTVAKWEGVSTRSGTISVGGQTFTVNQTGRRMKLNTDGIEADYNAHAITITIDALATTDWGIAVDSGWLSIVDGGSGKGGCDVALAINENPSYLPRTATALIGTETYTIRQLGRPTAALAFAISPETTAASVDGANGVVGVTATPDLPWSAQSEVSWLTVMPSFASGAGNGNMIYTASPNSTMSERTGAIVISPASASGKASKRHMVTQPAATAMISTDAHTFDAAGESFDVDVTIADIVNWSISENCDWVSISGELNRVGPGKVTIAASENLTVNPRTATVTIAGHSFAVTQLGRKVEVDYTAKTFDADGLDQQEDIEVHPDGNVSWMAYASDPSWIIIWGDENTTSDADGNVYGVGDATISYMVTDYVGDGQLKQGYIVVGDKTIYITQRGYDFDINPKGTSVSGNAGAGSVAVPATVGQVWNAVATEPWIKLVGNYDEVTGNGTVNYTFTDNDTGETRTGKIVIAGVEYTITQVARQMVTITATVMGEGGLVSGGGTYTLGTSVTLNAVVNDDDHKFVQWERGGNTLSTATSLAVTADVDQEIIAVFEKIKTYVVNDEEVKEGTTKSFTAPEPVVLGGTTQLVCRGTSAYPNKGTSFQMQITGNVSFEWDLWQTNYWIAINQTTGGTVSGPAGWVAAGTEATFTATPSGGKSLYRWLGIDDIASNESSIMSLVSHPLTVSAIFGTFNDTLATSVDADALKFTTGGDANWTPVIDATAQAGCSSAKSGVIGKESETWVETTVEGPGRITFSWRVDCEKDDGGNATWDRLAVFVDGQECRRIDGTTDWQTLTVRVLDDFYRPHTIRWSFYRDDYDSPSSGSENCGWVDNIKWQSDVD